MEPFKLNRSQVLRLLMIGGLSLGLFQSCGEKLPELGYQESRAAAREAYAQGDFLSFLNHTKAAQIYSPHHPGLIYNAAIGHTKLGQQNEAFKLLDRLVRMGLSYNLRGDEDFQPLLQTREFNDILTEMAFNRIAIVKSDRWREVPAPSAHIEGMAYDPRSGRIYFGEVRKRKVLFMTAEGEVHDLSTPEDGLLSVMGVALDSERNLLWAATAGLVQMEKKSDALNGQSALVAYNIIDGTKVAEYHPRSDDGKLFAFNDLAIAKDGTVYTADSRGSIWYLPAGADELKLLFEAQESFQGIALTPDERHLFVASYGSGVWKFDLDNLTSELLDYPMDVSLLGIDGLAYHKGRLIVVQNGARPYRLLGLTMNRSEDKITKVEVLERGHPDHGEPTLGQIIDDQFVYVANSPWSQYERSGQIRSGAVFRTTILLALPLDW